MHIRINKDNNLPKCASSRLGVCPTRRHVMSAYLAPPRLAYAPCLTLPPFTLHTPAKLRLFYMVCIMHCRHQHAYVHGGTDDDNDDDDDDGHVHIRMYRDAHAQEQTPMAPEHALKSGGDKPRMPFAAWRFSACVARPYRKAACAGVQASFMQRRPGCFVCGLVYHGSHLFFCTPVPHLTCRTAPFISPHPLTYRPGSKRVYAPEAPCKQKP